MTETIIPVEKVADRILILRGQRVILDTDLAKLYGVTTKNLNRAVKRNLERFPEDFMFQLTAEEFQGLRCQIGTLNQDNMGSLRSQIVTSNESANLRSQIVTSKSGRGGRRYLPYAFTEHGALMAASVLNTSRAVEVSVYVVRAFVRLREMLATHSELAKKLEKLESKLDRHDEEIMTIIETIYQLMALPESPKRRIGFDTE